MSALTGKNPGQNYTGLLHVSGPGPLHATTPRPIVLGDGSATPLSVTATALYINGVEAGTGTGGGTALTSYATQIATLGDYPTSFPPIIGSGANQAMAGNKTAADIGGATTAQGTKADAALPATGGTMINGTIAGTVAINSTSISFGSGAAAAFRSALEIDLPEITDSDGARTLALTDIGKYIRCTHATATAITIPQESSVAWPAGAIIVFRRAAGAITLAGTGVTINGGNASDIALHGCFAIRKTDATDIWDLI